MGLFTTSEETKDRLERLRRASGVRPNLWVRAAFCYSLSLPAEPEIAQIDSRGQEFPEKVFFGSDRDVLEALLRQRVERVPEALEIGPLVKAHVERGIDFVWAEFERLNKRGDELMLRLLEVGTTSDEKAPKAPSGKLPTIHEMDSYEIRALLGKNVRTDEEVRHSLNSPGRTPHVAIMGRNGTGKTRTGLSLLSSITTSAAYPVPFLIFDYAKGDIASNDEFVAQTNAHVIRLPDTPVPLAPLSLTETGEHALQLAARRFRSTIKSVVRLGAKQDSRCLQLVEQIFQDFEGSTPDLTDLVDLTEREYQTNGWPDDSLLAQIKDFGAFPLFRSAADGEDHAFFRESHIIDVHSLPADLRKLTVFLTLDRLYSEIMALPDAQLDKDGNRLQRLLIAIDEAHHYLPCKQPTLESMVREVRSKGVGIWLFSQSPDDFDQGQYNFAREMGLSIVFSCVVEKPRMLEAVLGGKIDPRRLSTLESGRALARPSDIDSPIEIQVWNP